MSLYIISPCFLENVDSKNYICDILNKFTQTNPYKVAIDTNDVLMSEYNTIADNRPGIASWLHFLSLKPPSSIEKISIPTENFPSDITNYLFFMCTYINGQKRIIFYSTQSIINHQISDDMEIEFNGCTIKLLDRDSALNEFTKNEVIYINKSIIASEGSTIKKGEING